MRKAEEKKGQKLRFKIHDSRFFSVPFISLSCSFFLCVLFFNIYKIPDVYDVSVVCMIFGTVRSVAFLSVSNFYFRVV